MGKVCVCAIIDLVGKFARCRFVCLFDQLFTNARFHLQIKGEIVKIPQSFFHLLLLQPADVSVWTFADAMAIVNAGRENSKEMTELVKSIEEKWRRGGRQCSSGNGCLQIFLLNT